MLGPNNIIIYMAAMITILRDLTQPCVLCAEMHQLSALAYTNCGADGIVKREVAVGCGANTLSANLIGWQIQPTVPKIPPW